MAGSMGPITALAGDGMSININSLLHVLQLISSQAQTRQIGCQTKMMFASCRVQPSDGSFVSGYIDFAQSVAPTCEPTGNLEIKVDLNGLPRGDGSTKHGFHIHELGDLSGGCGSTGGHYNPFNDKHGGPTSQSRHFGDLGNVEEDTNGRINTVLTDTVNSLTGLNSINGRAIVVHAKEDDLGTGVDTGSTTTGNSGSRLGCCVIGHSDGSRWEGASRLSNLGIRERPTRIFQTEFGR